jgi:hypothetical protein
MNGTTISPNGRPVRKSLASQLDRLDVILDTLGEGLNEAVATVVEQTVGKAVEVALKEVLTNPGVLRALRDQLPASRSESEASRASGPQPNLFQQALARARATVMRVAAVTATSFLTARAWVGPKVRQAAQRVAERCARIRNRLSGLLSMLWHGRKVVLAALGAGLLVGLGCYHAGPLVASTVSGLAAFAGSVAAGVGRWLRRPRSVSAEAA